METCAMETMCFSEKNPENSESGVSDIKDDFQIYHFKIDMTDFNLFRFTKLCN